ncbi:hypothetical protein FQN57_002155 [Myotisia sp. PD_48]|nr:hypothetical protein FQN57_002155 [Myotisia sp. PD_48]
MQFALPPRKSSQPPIYSRPASSGIRRRQLKSCGIVTCIAISILYFIFHILSSDATDTSAAHGPPVVVVTMLDEEQFSDPYIQKIKQNREDYVKRHGYVNFFASTVEYLPAIKGAPRSWALIPAMRHALSLYPGSTYFFHLSPHAVIMDPSVSLASHVLDRSRLDSLMIKDVPVVPPDSVIKTFNHIGAKDVDLIISQDLENLSPGSFILRRGEWAKFFLDAWFDPLYRSYNFAKSEVHALDHIVQWHPTILAKLALIPQRIINSYSSEVPNPGENGRYKDGDFIIRVAGCETTAERNCEKEMEPYFQKWANKQMQNK